MQDDAARWRRFTAHLISHDLRAHLRALGGYTRMLQTRTNACADPDIQALVERLRGETRRADCAVRNVVELLRIEDSTLNCQPCDLSLLADWALMDVNADACQVPVELHVEGAATTHGDEALLRSLLTHLLHNVRAFAQADATPRATLTLEMENDTATLRLRDAGRGVDAGDTDVFAAGARLHGVSEGGGNGLGLTIARRIVERHGGSIAFTSAAGEGATVTVRLPVAHAAS